MKIPTTSQASEYPSMSETQDRATALFARIAKLEDKVDQVYEWSDPAAEDLDAQLAELRERAFAADAELAEWEEGGERELPDYHEGLGVDEQLLNAYVHYLRGDRSDVFAGSRSNIIAHMRRVIEDAACAHVTATDQEILAAARDVYEARRALATRRRTGKLRFLLHALSAP